MAHQLEIIGRAQAARPAADDGDTLARARPADGSGHNARVIHRIALESTNVDRGIQHVAAAARLARMLADERTGRRERIILADQAHRVGTAPFADERDVARNIHTCRAQRHAGHGLVDVVGAVARLDMGDVFVSEPVQTAQHHPRRFRADGTVRRNLDVLRQPLDFTKRCHCRASVEHIFQIRRQLSQSDAAGHAFSTGLRMAEPKEVQRQIHRADAGRAGYNAAFQILIQTLYGLNRLVLDCNFESAHITPPCFFVKVAQICLFIQ